MDTSNDNARFPDGFPGVPDAHGQAAMLLVESLLHGLIARSVIDVSDAVEIVQIAAQVSEDIGQEMRDPPAKSRTSLDLLKVIEASLMIDLEAP